MSEFSNIILPKKIFFYFDINESDSKFHEILNQFYGLAEQELFEWEKIDFPLPSSILSGLNVEKFDLGIKDYLNTDECKHLSKDEHGQPKPLTQQQLSQLREHGIFKVQSLQFPDKYHIWKIHWLLQKGTSKTYSDFLKDLSRVVNLMIITARNRVNSKHNSIMSCNMNVWRGLCLLFDLLFGLPHNNPGNIGVKMEEECLQFLTCELNVSKGDQTLLHQFWDYVEQLSCLPNHYGAEKLKEYFPVYIEENKIPFGIYQFLTPDHLIVDFRLANRTLKMKCLDIAKDALREVEESDWFIDFRKNYIEKVYGDSYSLDVIEKDLRKTGLKAKVNKVYEIIQMNCKKSDIPEAICEMMISNAKYFLICSEVDNYLKELWLSYRSETLDSLHQAHPFLSQTSLWISKQLKKAQKQFISKHEFTKLKVVINSCASEELRQHEYFSRRYFLFMKERKPLIEHEFIRNSSFPDRQYRFSSRMILPQYWKVHQTKDTDGKTIYTVNKCKELRWTSRYPCWRWINFFLHTYMIILTVGQFLLIKVPFKTPVSYLSLFLRKPFSTKYYFDQKTGSISPLESSTVLTMYSRLLKLWRYVWDCRNKFENSAFNGLLDKSVARHFHRLWVVVLQGGMGTLCIILIMPILCIFSSTICCILGVLVPLWIPFVTLIMYIGSVLVFDFQKAETNKNRFFCLFEAILWDITFCGICQLYVILSVLIVVLPLLACIFLLCAIIKISIRYVWDAFIFYMILRKHAHIPASNDFVAKRISGPGLAYDYEILVKPEHVLIGLRCLLEKEELDLWLKQVSFIIKQPLTHYMSFIESALEPLAVSINTSHKRIERLRRIEEESLTKVHRDYNNRLDMLNIKYYTPSDKEGRLRLSSKDLQIVLDKSEKLCEQFYREKLEIKIKCLSQENSSWWIKRNIKTGDFKNLAVNSLSHLFGEQILSSIEDCDEAFHLELNNLTLSAYMAMFITESYSDGHDQPIILNSSNTNMDSEHLQIKLRNFMLPNFSASNFFGHDNEEFPSVLKSWPNSTKKRIRRRIFRSFKDWLKCCSNYYESLDSNDETMTISGHKEPWDLGLYHPLIICTLLHSRDRDNSMVDHDHVAVKEGVKGCMQMKYSPEFFDTINMINSIDYSMSSLDNLSCDVRPCLI